MKIVIAALSLLSLCAGTVCADEDKYNKHSLNHPKAWAYFVPFSVETFVPVTPTSIPKDGSRIVLEENDVVKIKHLLAQRGQISKFDKRLVRLQVQVVRPNKVTFMVDRNGTVLQGIDQYSLTPLALLGLDHLLTHLNSVKRQKH